MSKVHYHMRPHGEKPYRWVIDGYNARGGWEVTYAPTKGLTKSEAKRKLKEFRRLKAKEAGKCK